MKASEFNRFVEKYIRPSTYPIGFRLVKHEGEVPEKARRFEGITICQAYNMARRYKWTVYFDANTICPIGLVAYGFCEADELYRRGELAYDAGYASTKEAGIEFENAVAKLRTGEYSGAFVFPLERDEAVPDFAVIYGTPAQILRLIHSVLHERGGAFETRILGRAACSEYLEAFIEKKPRFVLPCYGDRLFGLTQDDEVAFAFPWSMAEEIARNLEATHKRGIRYPVPATSLRLKLSLPKSYEESLKNMKKSD
ncbi:DUF169 domain-containing protein [Geoglobus acetivorans]|uniref:DUF169 domain-containing protein n=1 Tax=Geoglobus acetivorans TaxID=565033 RepID=UPI00064E5DF6